MGDLLSLRKVLLVKVLVLPLKGGDIILKNGDTGEEVCCLLRRDRRWIIFYFIIVIIVVYLYRWLNIGRGRLLLISYID